MLRRKTGKGTGRPGGAQWNPELAEGLGLGLEGKLTPVLPSGFPPAAEIQEEAPGHSRYGGGVWKTLRESHKLYPSMHFRCLEGKGVSLISAVRSVS